MVQRKHRRNPQRPLNPSRDREGAGLGQAGSIVDMLTAAALKYGLDAGLVLAQARAESNLNQAAVSSAGAIGVMQLMPATATWLGVDPYNVAENIEGGVRYLSMMLQQFGGDTAKALAAYNWGPGNLTRAITRWGERWIEHLPGETRNYITRITGSLPSIGIGMPPGDTLAVLLLAALLLFVVLS